MEHTTISIEEKILSKLLRIRKGKKGLLLMGISFALILIIVGTSWISGRTTGKKISAEELSKLQLIIQEQDETIRQLKEDPIVVSPVSPEIVLDIISSEIKEIGELATVEYLFTDAARFTDSKQIKDWNIPFTEKSFMLKWSGIIKAGVKLEQIKIDVNETEKKLLVSIPTAEILSYDIDESSIEILDEKNNIFNNITIEDKVQFDAKNEEAMKERAIENGLLEKAQKSAENIIAQLLSTNPAIGDIYTIEFVPTAK